MVRLKEWKSSDWIKTKEEAEAYLAACVEEDPGDGSLVKTGLDTLLDIFGSITITKKENVTDNLQVNPSIFKKNLQVEKPTH